MNHKGPIIIIEDDEDDQEILQEIFTRLDCQNKILFFSDGFKAINYFDEHNIVPFLIISDMNLPKISGLELRDLIRKHDNYSLRCTPYVFFTTAANKRDVLDAYQGSVQGFFIKPPNMGELEGKIRKILDYWSDSVEPS
jgi:CheY-like chemotaxis protein